MVLSNTEKITFLLNWRATSYHVPLYIAHSKGYFKEQGINVSILQPNDPSEVTELIGAGKVDLGLKAMIHTFAGKARGYPIKAIGSLLDEPLTGLIYLKNSGITEDFESLRGKRIGYVGEFGKIQIDELTRYYGMTPDDYTAVYCGMNVSKAIVDGTIDAGIGLENVQMVELAEWLESQGRPRDDVQMLRIDELAELGCCSCTILYVGNEEFIARNPEKVSRFMRAIKKATDFVLAQPDQAWREYIVVNPFLDTVVDRKIFERSYAYFSDSLMNVGCDWNKVTMYGKRLLFLPGDFANYTNEFLSWKLPLENGPGILGPLEVQQMMKELQSACAAAGGFHRLALSA